MRDLPWLTNDIAARASRLSAQSLEARKAMPGVPDPKNTISPARVVDGVATLRLYDYIDGEGGYWGVSANEVADALDAIEGPVDRLELWVNSGGGSVWDGLAILNELRGFDAPVTARVTGIAASAASFIAVACDETVMMPNSKLMIHDAMGLCMGQADDMRGYADFLDESSDGIAEIYAERAGGTTAGWRATMKAKGLLGQWYSAQEAVDAGLADRVETASSEDQPPADKLRTPCGCGPADVEGIEHKRECTEKVDALKARNRAKHHELAARRHGFTAA
jgi:ATP-dependent protease ClpP protease subunit